MPTVVSCECGQSFQAADWLAGREVPCPSCGTNLTIPGAAPEAEKTTAAETPAASAEKIVVACKCGKRFQAGAKLLGKVVKCPGCGNPLKVQKAGATAATTKPAAQKNAAAPARPSPARTAPAKPAPAADADPLAMDLSTFDSTGFDQAGFDQAGLGPGGLGGGIDQGGFGGGGLGADAFGTGGFDQGALGQPGFDQGGFGQGGLDQGGLASPMDSLSMGYGQPQGDAAGYGYQGGGPQQESSGGRSFELSPKMLVILMSVGGGVVGILLMAIFIPPIYRYFTTPAEVVVVPDPNATAAAQLDATPLPWVPYVSPTGGYSADFPGTPSTTPTSPNSFAGLPGVDSPASVHLSTRGQYSIGRVALPQAVESQASRKLWIPAAMDAFTKSAGGQTVVSQRNIVVDGNPGVDARIEGKNQQGLDYESQCKIVLTKTHLYYLVYAIPKGQVNQEDANRFFGSFKLTSSQ